MTTIAAKIMALESAKKNRTYCAAKPQVEIARLNASSTCDKMSFVSSLDLLFESIKRFCNLLHNRETAKSDA